MLVLALDLASYLALALAAGAAFRGGPAAAALVISNLICRGADLLEFDFPMRVWVYLDLTVIFAIAIAAFRRRYILSREIIICSLFLFAWRFYVLPPSAGEHEKLVQYCVLSGVVICQLLLTLPWRTLFYRARCRMGYSVGKAPHHLERAANA